MKMHNFAVLTIQLKQTELSDLTPKPECSLVEGVSTFLNSLCLYFSIHFQSLKLRNMQLKLDDS